MVTGGAGFIGTHVVRALLALGADVCCVDRDPPRPTGGERAGLSAVQVDLTRPGAVEETVTAGIDAVVHLAAVTSVLGSRQHPALTYETNVGVTARLLEQARRLGTPRVVLASTNAVVGDAGGAVIDERSVLRPLTPYGATKAAAEMLLGAWAASYGLGGVALRLTNVYGPGMHTKDSVVARLMRAAATDTGFDVYGDGAQVRDYVHVADVTAAVVRALSPDGPGPAWDGPVVIGSGRSTAVVDLLGRVRAVTGAAIPVRHVAAQAGEMPAVVVDVGRAAELGWRPTVELDAGLRQVWAAWPAPERSELVATPGS